MSSKRKAPRPTTSPTKRQKLNDTPSAISTIPHALVSATTKEPERPRPVASSSNADPQPLPSATDADAPKAEITPLRWKNMPEWNREGSPFLQLPVEILDLIVSRASDLALQDHLALSGTCNVIRAAYTPEVWKDLLYPGGMLRYHGGVFATKTSKVDRLFSNALQASFSATEKTSGQETQEGQSPSQVNQVQKLLEDSYLDRVVKEVNGPEIYGTDAKKRYKVTDTELATLKCSERQNPRRRNSTMRKYKVAAVWALALKSHGGPLGHQNHLKALANRAARANATREKNGTKRVPKPRVPYFLNQYEEEYDDDDFSGFYDNPYNGYHGPFVMPWDLPFEA